jgi:hypothetical protein
VNPVFVDIVGTLQVGQNTGLGLRGEHCCDLELTFLYLKAQQCSPSSLVHNFSTRLYHLPYMFNIKPAIFIKSSSPQLFNGTVSLAPLVTFSREALLVFFAPRSNFSFNPLLLHNVWTEVCVV